MNETETVVDMLSALGQRTRIDAYRVIAASGADGIPATEIATHLKVAPNSLSTHLAILARAGLVDQERDGRFIRYRATPDTMRSLAEFLVGL